MLTTKGYRDILHIARHKRPLSFSLYQDVPWQKHPLVRRRYRRPISERIIAPQGEVLTPLDEDEVREAVRRLKREGVEAIAVCFLFSFLNPKHEQRAKAIILEEYPECYLSVRHEVLPQYREYEGFSTVCLNAYVGPQVSQYVRRLDRTITAKGIRGGLPPDDLGRRGGNHRRRGPTPGQPAHVRAGGRPDRRDLDRQEYGLAQRDYP